MIGSIAACAQRAERYARRPAQHRQHIDALGQHHERTHEVFPAALHRLVTQHKELASSRYRAC
ncbi:hypothetical protein, partial [Caballeronia sp. LZ002]|uniref:hypothetical protein n=1 Tax=Caballeronia sp. LZ002 TaxID=3038558 RepID=UPI00286D4DEE